MNPSSAPSIVVAWRLRTEALPPVGVAARGAAARVLALRLLQRDDATLAKLEGISAGEWLILRGAADDLPWADGAIYLGRDTAAPALLLPTLWQSVPDAALLQCSLKNRFQSAASLAVVPPCAHRDAAQFTTIAPDEILVSPNAEPSSRNANDAPLSTELRVLANAPTLVFSLKNARRISRAPLENWLRAQGEEPSVAPPMEHEAENENGEKSEIAAEISPIGDLRSGEDSSLHNTVASARLAEETR